MLVEDFIYDPVRVKKHWQQRDAVGKFRKESYLIEKIQFYIKYSIYRIKNLIRKIIDK